MKLATFSDDAAPRAGLVVEDGIVDIGAHLLGRPMAMIELIDTWDSNAANVDALSRIPADVSLAKARLHAPVPRPGKIMGIGLNYADHAAEAELELPSYQMWFSKAVTSITGPFDPIILPKVSDKLDYEAELVFIVGKRCRHVSRDEARSAIFGFCVGNDVTVRDWQFRTSQFTLGKSFDTHAPFGPWITTADAIDPHALGIRCLVNGEQRQNSRTSHFIFDCYDQLAYLSQAMTLEPGDAFFTGTPAGVGAAMTPPQFLQDGDVVRVAIDGLGEIESVVRAE